MKNIFVLTLMLLLFSGTTQGQELNKQPTNLETNPKKEETTTEKPLSQSEKLDQMLERIRKQREEREAKARQKLFENFSEKFGDNPFEYDLNYRLSGQNITIFGVSYWIKFHVKPEEGTIKLQHTTATRDLFWGTTNWYDHQVISVKVTFDSEACKIVSDGNKCEFTGQDEIKLNNFLANHLIIKNALWDIKYIESQEERQIGLRIPSKELPENAKEDAKIEEINSAFCQVFPLGLNCAKKSSSN